MRGPVYRYKQFNQKGESVLNLRGDESEFTEPIISVWDAEGYYLISNSGLTSWGPHIDLYMPSVVNGKSCFAHVKQSIFSKPEYSINNQKYYLIDHNSIVELYNECLGVKGPNIKQNMVEIRTNCDRDYETAWESIDYFKINGWSVFSNIRNQFLESRYVFHADVSMGYLLSNGTVATGTVKMVTLEYTKDDLLNCPSGTSCTGKNIYVDFRFWSEDWNWAILGSPINISWAEVDNGSTTVTFSLVFGVEFKLSETQKITGAVTASVSRTGSAIVNLGSNYVHYCNPLSTLYNTGSVTFKTK